MKPTLTLDLTWKVDTFSDKLSCGAVLTIIAGVRLVGATLTREDGITIFTIGTDTGAINLDYVVKMVRYAVMYSGNDAEFILNVQVI